MAADPEGGLSTTSSTKLSTRTGVQRTPVLYEREPVQPDGATPARQAETGSEPAAASGGRHRVPGPRMGRRPAAGSHPGRPSRPATRRRPSRRSRPTSPPCSPRNVRNPSSRARSSIRAGRSDPAALRELDVDPGRRRRPGPRGPRGGRSSRRPRSAATSAPGASAAGRAGVPGTAARSARRRGARDRAGSRPPPPASRPCWRRPGSGRRTPREPPRAWRGRPVRRP